MQFYNYINEKVDFEQLKKTLKKKCRPVLKDLASSSRLKQLPLIGKKVNLKQNYKIRRTRKNRRPQDTPMEIHDFIDDYFQEKYGERFRSSAIFATGRYSTARVYGNVYMILPVGDYEVLWSRQVSDLYSEFLEKSSDVENCIWAVATGESPKPTKDEDELEREWEDIYGEGRDGMWVFGDYESYQSERIDAALEIAEEIGFNPDYDIDDKMRIEDIYFNSKSFIVNFKEQRTLFDDAIEVAALRYDGEALATMYRAKNGKYYVVESEGDRVADKQGNDEFEYKEDAWQAYRRQLVKDAVEEQGIPISMEILTNFYDEEWAEEKLEPFREAGRVYGTADNPIDAIEDELVWEPEVDLETFIDEYEGDSDMGGMDCEEFVYDILDSYQKGDIVNAIRSKNEMMISCDQYILIDFDLNSEIVNWIKDEIR